MDQKLKELTKYLFATDSEVDFRIKNDTERFRKGFGSIHLADTAGKPVEKAHIELKLKKHEFYFGCNAFMYGEFKRDEQNAAYAETFRELFNLAVVPFYWSDFEPEEGKPRFAKDSTPVYRRPAPDLVLEYCEANHITAKGHPLLWHHFYPDWLRDIRRSGELIDRIERRFSEIADHYRHRIKIWDVINEVLAWNPYVAVMPPEQIELVFKLAEKYFSAGSMLIYNDVTDRSWRDYNADYTPLTMLGRRLLDRGCRVGCLGLQYHLFYQDVEAMLAANVGELLLKPERLLMVMDTHAKLGIPCNVSEITVSGADMFGGDELQAAIVERLYRVWFSHPANNAIVWWNLVDGTAAYAPQGSLDGENKFKAGLVNYDFSRKPAFDVIRRLIREEWTTATSLEYDSHEIFNKFHGFYGDYDVTVKTANGTFHKEISLCRDVLNDFKLVLD